MKSKSIALSAIVTAIGFIFLFLSSVIPTGKLVCLCIATATICVVVIESGLGMGAVSGMVLGALGWLFLPDKLTVLVFSVFFVFYPVLKSLFENISNVYAGIILKICLFSVFSILAIFFGKTVGLLPEKVVGFLEDGKFLAAVFLGIIVCFVLFDYALSRVITVYLTVIRPKINR